MKLCKRCDTEKPATTEFFYRNSQQNDGLHSYCKECKSRIHKEYMQDPDIKAKFLKKVRDWQKIYGKDI